MYYKKYDSKKWRFPNKESIVQILGQEYVQ